MGGWAVAQSPILRTTITIKRLEKRGYVNLIKYYNLKSVIIEAPSTRPAWFILSLPKDRWCERRSPSDYLADPSTQLPTGFLILSILLLTLQEALKA
jgi:hypothetical protein